MQWLQYAAFLACPLMMLFCMKGMFSGNKDKKVDAVQPGVSQKEFQDLQIKMADVMEQNQKLTREVQAMKVSHSNVVELNEEKSKRVVS